VSRPTQIPAQTKPKRPLLQDSDLSTALDSTALEDDLVLKVRGLLIRVWHCCCCKGMFSCWIMNAGRKLSDLSRLPNPANSPHRPRPPRRRRSGVWYSCGSNDSYVPVNSRCTVSHKRHKLAFSVARVSRC